MIIDVKMCEVYEYQVREKRAPVQKALRAGNPSEHIETTFERTVGPPIFDRKPNYGKRSDEHITPHNPLTRFIISESDPLIIKYH
jgi:hypothetical protein